MRKLFAAFLVAAILLGGDLIWRAASQTNTFCASNLTCTVTALWNFSSGNLQLNGVGVADVSSAQSVSNKTFTSSTLDISANTLKNSSNAAGHIPRNNGTQYVDAQLGFADLSGTASTSQIGTGTPAAGKYVDGGTGAWTSIPATGATEFTLSATVPSAVSLTVACVEGGTGLCDETVFAKAHTLVRLTYNLSQAPASCATNAVLAVKDMTSSTILASITVTQNPAQFVDSGALAVATTAGDKILVGTTTAAASCTTVPNVNNVTAVFQ